MTAFTRIIIVLSVLRQALGLTTTPPNMVLAALALALTVFVMRGVIQQEQTKALQPYLAGQINFETAMQRAEPPIQNFMLAQTRKDPLHLFVDLSGGHYDDPQDVPLAVLVPAFATSELETAFQIASSSTFPLCYRSRGCLRADVARHDHGLADTDLAAAETADVRLHPWLGAGAGLARQQLSTWL